MPMAGDVNCSSPGTNRSLVLLLARGVAEGWSRLLGAATSKNAVVCIIRACESEAGQIQKQVSSLQPVSHRTTVANLIPSVAVPHNLVLYFDPQFLESGDYAYTIWGFERVVFGGALMFYFLAFTFVRVKLQNVDACML